MWDFQFWAPFRHTKYWSAYLDNHTLDAPICQTYCLWWFWLCACFNLSSRRGKKDISGGGACLENLVHKLGWTETKILKNLTAQNLQGLRTASLTRTRISPSYPLIRGRTCHFRKGYRPCPHSARPWRWGFSVRTNTISLADLLTPQGIFKAEIALVGGQHFSKVAPAILEALQAANFLSKRILCTATSFVAIKKTTDLSRNTPMVLTLGQAAKPHTLPCPKTRQGALGALETIRFIPENGKRLCHAAKSPRLVFIKAAPLGHSSYAVVNSKGELLVNPDVNEMLLSRVKQEGSHFWWTDDADTLLKPFGLAGYTKVMDIIDVWFESGMTHQIALTNLDSTNTNDVESGHWPADLYLEGSDQHGWFQSSLVLSQALWGKAPYKTLLTHGFIVDQTGQNV